MVGKSPWGDNVTAKVADQWCKRQGGTCRGILLPSFPPHCQNRCSGNSFYKGKSEDVAYIVALTTDGRSVTDPTISIS